MEYHHGHFERQLRRHQTVDCDAIQAEFANGILIIMLTEKRDEAPALNPARKDAS